nr:protein MAIN-LIKE 1-like [Nicotiana tomentosiformis]
MIERWRPETHTFHLPIGEATIMLEDEEVLFGLPVDGLPVAYQHALRDYRGFHYMHMLQRLTRFQPAEETALSGASRLPLTPVQQHLEAVDAEITDDSPPEVIGRHTRLVLLLMFDGVLWGATVIGYLYRQMCRASMGTQRDVAGFLSPLQLQPAGMVAPPVSEVPALPIMEYEWQESEYLPRPEKWLARSEQKPPKRG